MATNRIDQLTNAISAQQIEAIKSLLVEKKVNPNDTDSFGRRPLEVAVASRNIQIVKVLEEFSSPPIDFFAKSRDGKKQSILHKTVEGSNDDPKIIEYLIDEHGVSVVDADDDNTTPILIACKKGFGNVANFLVSRGAEIRIEKNRFGEDPVSVSEKKEVKQLVTDVTAKGTTMSYLHLSWLSALADQFQVSVPRIAHIALVKGFVYKKRFLTRMTEEQIMQLPDSLPLGAKMSLIEIIQKSKRESKKEQFSWLQDLASIHKLDLPDEIFRVAEKNGIDTQDNFLRFADVVQQSTDNAALNFMVDAPANIKVFYWKLIDAMNKAKHQQKGSGSGGGGDWLQQLGRAHQIDIPQELEWAVAKNGITKDLFYTLSELDCKSLEGAPLNCKLILWTLVRRESGEMSEVERLRHQNAVLQNQLEEKAGMLRQVTAESLKQ